MKEMPSMPQPKTEKKDEPITPEDVGFQSVKGADYLSGNKDSSSRIEQIGIDNIAERKGRFKNMLSNIERIAGDREAIDNLNKTMARIEADNTFGEKNNDVVDFLNFTKSTIANFKDKAALKLVLERGSKERVQESLIIGRGFINSPELEELGEGIKNAAYAATELAMELYAQEHGGRGYRTTEQVKEFEEAKKRSAKIKVS